MTQFEERLQELLDAYALCDAARETDLTGRAKERRRRKYLALRDAFIRDCDFKQESV